MLVSGASEHGRTEIVYSCQTNLVQFDDMESSTDVVYEVSCEADHAMQLAVAAVGCWLS